MKPPMMVFMLTLAALFTIVAMAPLGWAWN
jgi:hypothetical protein